MHLRVASVSLRACLDSISLSLPARVDSLALCSNGGTHGHVPETAKTWRHGADLAAVNEAGSTALAFAVSFIKYNLLPVGCS